MRRPPFLIITPGDMNGIGPEVTLKALSMLPPSDDIPVVLGGPPNIWKFYATRTPGLQLRLFEARDAEDIKSGGIYLSTFNELLFEVPDLVPRPGKLDADSGRISMKCIEQAISLCLSGDAAAMVTAPISKEAVNLAGYNIPGHTEFLAEKDGAEHVAMMLVGGNLRVVPFTTHIPVSDVAAAISEQGIIKKTRIIYRSLKNDFSLENPRIAVLGLNPHAGDGGVIGREEVEIISPAIKKLNEEGIICDGPFPADGFFAGKSYTGYDAILAMYHDQGLIPFKTLAFGKGVNMTAGLSFIRTSPDHGTAFGIAGSGKADPGSMVEAVALALGLARLRMTKAETRPGNPSN